MLRHSTIRLLPRSFAALVAAAALLLSAVGAPGGPGDPPPAPNRYIGAAKCKNCHSNQETGDQYGVWQKEKHASAYETLASAKAKEYGKARDIADPQKSDKCLKCHTTAFGEPKESIHRSFDAKLGVQCETCHGPGENHLKARMVAAAKEDEAGTKTAYAVIPDDEIIKAPTAKTCVGCHNDESPGFKPFCFHKFSGEIQHLNPKRPRTDAEKAAMKECACDDKCVCKKDGKCTELPEAKK